MLLYRILTVLVIAPLFFWVNLYASDAWFNLFWPALVALAAREWGGLLRWPPRRQWKYALINAGIAALGLLLLEYGLGGVAKSRLLFYILAAAALLWLFAVPYALYRYGRDQRLNLPDSLLAVAGSIMLLAFVWATVAIQRMIGGSGLLGLFIIVFTFNFLFCREVNGVFVFVDTNFTLRDFHVVVSSPFHSRDVVFVYLVKECDDIAL